MEIIQRDQEELSETMESVANRIINLSDYFAGSCVMCHKYECHFRLTQNHFNYVLYHVILTSDVFLIVLFNYSFILKVLQLFDILT